MRPVRVAIIGAGIGGLTAAAALFRRGFEVAVHERATDLAEVGAGLQIGPNAVKVLKALGIEDDIRRLGFEPTAMVSLNWNDARLRSRDLLRGAAEVSWGARYITAHRKDLHDLLKSLIPVAAMHLGAQCVDCVALPKGALARFADGHEVEADVIIGADGIHSAVRKSLFGADAPRFTHQMAWRCMVPAEYLPARVGPDRAVPLDRGDYIGWLGPDGHVICYPICGGRIINVFAGHISETWVNESWAVPSSQGELLAAYTGWNEALLGMLSHVGDVYKWGIYDRDPLSRWTQGTITLLGDAAHPMMPTLAQGAAVTIEDGYVLGECLARHRDNAIAGLALYESLRRPRTQTIQLQARQQFENNCKVPPPPPLDRGWIFSFDATSPQLFA